MIKSKLLTPICLLILGLLLSGCTLPFIKKKQGALQITSNVKATVFLNNNHVGQTPYFDDKLKQAEYMVKLVPDSDDSSIISWQGIVKLNPGIMTVINRNLGSSESQSSGYVLALEPISEKEKVKIFVVSTPDGVVVDLDGEPKGFSPLSLEDVTEGERLFSISSPGFKEETFKAKVLKGYKLMVDVQLAKEEEEEAAEEDKEASESAKKPEDKDKNDKEASPSSKEAEMEKPYVKIKETPTGWLKVRSEPSTAGGDETVITKIYPDEVYKYIENNETGWYKIEYKEGEEGWISGQYAVLNK